MRTIQIAPLLAVLAVSTANSLFGAADGIFPASTPEADRAIHWSDHG